MTKQACMFSPSHLRLSAKSLNLMWFVVCVSKLPQISRDAKIVAFSHLPCCTSHRADNCFTFVMTFLDRNICIAWACQRMSGWFNMFLHCTGCNISPPGHAFSMAFSKWETKHSKCALRLDILIIRWSARTCSNWGFSCNLNSHQLPWTPANSHQGPCELPQTPTFWIHCAFCSSWRQKNEAFVWKLTFWTPINSHQLPLTHEKSAKDSCSRCGLLNASAFPSRSFFLILYLVHTGQQTICS